MQFVAIEAGRGNGHEQLVGLQLLEDQRQQLLLPCLGIAGRGSHHHVGLVVGQCLNAVRELDALQLWTSIACVGSAMQRLALGKFGVALGAEAQLANSTAIALDHILVAGTLQIDLGIDGLLLAVVDSIRLDEQMRGCRLIVGVQAVGEEALQTRLQLMELLCAVHGLLVGYVAAPGALGPGAGRSGDGTTCTILAQILKVLGLAFGGRRCRAAGQAEIFLDVLHLAEGHLALALVQAANGAIVAAVLIRIVALSWLFAQGAQVGVLLLEQAIRVRMRRVVAHQARLHKELRQRLEFALCGRDLRIGRHLEHIRVLQFGNGNPVAHVAAKAGVARLGAAQLLQRMNRRRFLYQNNALIAEVS